MIRSAVFAMGASLFASTAALAQADAAQQGTADAATSTEAQRSGDEIIVTAQRRAEVLTDVPLSISAFSEETLVSSGIREISSLSLTNPGMITQQGVGYTQIYIRGIGNAIYLGADPSVATFIDDTPRIYGSLTNNFINVQRVEVLKGAQGGLYGRNATGGVINIVTKQPGDELAMQARISAGERKTIDAAAYVNIPVSDGIAVNFSANRKYHDPYIKNLNTPNHYHSRTNVDKLNEQDFWAVDGKVRFGLSENLTVTLGGDFARKADANGAGWYQADTATTYATYVGFMTAFGLAPFILPKAQAFPDKTEKFTGRVPGDVFVNIDDYGGYGKVELALADIDLSSITSFRWNETGYVNNSGAGAVPLLSNNVFNNKRNFYQELRAISAGTGPFQWLAGATYLTDHFRANANGTLLGFLDTPVTSSLTKTKAWSAYAEGVYDLTEQLSIRASLRYIDEKKTVTYLTISPIQEATLKSNKLLPSATLSYKIGDGTLYARYAKGFKTGGANPLVAPTAFSSNTGLLFAPEQVDTYEAGYRAQLFDGNVQFTSAVFYNNYKNIQVVANGARPQITYAIVNAQSARTYGAEASLTWRVMPVLTLSANAGYLNAKYKTFVVPVQPDLLFSDNSGNRMQLAPRWQGSLTVNLDQPVGNGLRLSGNALYAYIGSFFFEERNLPIGRQKGYSLVNGRIGVSTEDNEAGLYVFATNLFNKEYAAFGSVASPYGTAFVSGDPRIIGGMLEVNF